MPIELYSKYILNKNNYISIINSNLYPINGFIYFLKNKYFNLNALWNCINHLNSNNIPFNLLFNRNELYLFVRQSKHSKSKYPIFYGFSDISGFITILNENVFNKITYKQIFNDLKYNISISDQNFKSVKEHCLPKTQL